MLEALYSQEKVDELREYHARQEGEKKGAFGTLAKLLQNKKITKADAADSLGMSLAQFNKMYKDFAPADC